MRKSLLGGLPSTMASGFDLKFKLYEKVSLGGINSWITLPIKKKQLDYIVQIHLAHFFISVAGLFLTIEIDWTLIESVSNLTCVDMYPSGLGMSTSQPSL